MKLDIPEGYRIKVSPWFDGAKIKLQRRWGRVFWETVGHCITTPYDVEYDARRLIRDEDNRRASRERTDSIIGIYT